MAERSPSRVRWAEVPSFSSPCRCVRAPKLRRRPPRNQKNNSVVDDDPDIRHFLKERLSAYGSEIETATDGAHALHLLSRTPFDGMILDISMPELDGLAVLRQIRERSSMPIIMVTASGAKDRAGQAISIGAQDYLLKPFDVRQLREVVERWFGANASIDR